MRLCVPCREERDDAENPKFRCSGSLYGGMLDCRSLTPCPRALRQIAGILEWLTTWPPHSCSHQSKTTSQKHIAAITWLFLGDLVGLVEKANEKANEKPSMTTSPSTLSCPKEIARVRDKVSSTSSPSTGKSNNACWPYILPMYYGRAGAGEAQFSP